MLSAVPMGVTSGRIMPDLAPWLVCATEGCQYFGLRWAGKFCSACGSECLHPVPKCCAREDSTENKGFCSWCGTLKTGWADE